MCGRYVIKSPVDVLLARFGATLSPALQTGAVVPRYNVAPTQDAPVVVEVDEGRRLGLMRWGLVPRWAEDLSVGSRSINARGETVGEKPTFRDSLERKRCLVAADGFYEWATVPGRGRVPMLFQLASGAPFAIAGLWALWKKGDLRVATFTVLTTRPNRLVSPVHDRMPAIVRSGLEGTWLARKALAPEELDAVIEPYPDEEMRVHEVGKAVGTPRNDDPSLIEPIVTAPGLF